MENLKTSTQITIFVFEKHKKKPSHSSKTIECRIRYGSKYEENEGCTLHNQIATQITISDLLRILPFYILNCMYLLGILVF